MIGSLCLVCHKQDFSQTHTRLHCLSTEIICQQVRHLLSLWLNSFILWWWIHTGLSCDQVGFYSRAQKMSHNKKNRIMITLSFLELYRTSISCWCIFALISKQARLRMWLYYLCHSVTRARPLLMLSHSLWLPIEVNVCHTLLKVEKNVLQSNLSTTTPIWVHSFSLVLSCPLTTSSAEPLWK